MHGIDILSVVTCRMNQQYTFRFGVFYRFVHPMFFRRKSFTKAHIYHLRAIINGITDSQRNILIMLITIWYRPNGHDLYIVSDAIHTHSILPGSSYDPGYMGTM